MPKISIVIPTFNRKEYLSQAVESVLAQENADFEIIISDNCSTDGTEHTVRKYLSDPRVRYCRNDSNLGMIGNWRKAVFERARYDWFMLMSDDDYLTDTSYLSEASQMIDEGKPCLVYAGGRIEDVSSGVSSLLLPPFCGLVDGRQVFVSRDTVKPQDFLLCNVLFKRGDALRLGFLQNEDNLSSDSELFLKLSLEGQIGVIRKPVCVYRMHPGNLTKKILKSARLLRGNLEYMVLPYSYGIALGTAPEVLELYKINTHLRIKVQGTLLRIASHDQAAFEECRQFMRRNAPDVLKSVESRPTYRLLLRLVRRFPSLPRRVYGIGS